MIFFSSGKRPGYNFRRSSFLQDDFRSGATGGGNIGETGWSSSGGVTSYLTAEPNRPGIVRSSTTTVSGTIRAINWFGQNFAMDATNTSWRFLADARLNTNDANTTVRIGPMNSHGNNPPASGVYFEKLDGDTNWFCVLRSGGVETGTRINSGVAVTTSFMRFHLISTNSTVTFWIGAALVGTLSANYPIVDLIPALQIVNSAAADKTLDIDYAELEQWVIR